VRAIDSDRIEDRERIGSEIFDATGLRRALLEPRSSVTAQVDSDHAEKSLELGELRLPGPAVRAERMQQHECRGVLTPRHDVMDPFARLVFDTQSSVDVQSALYLS
jgi:hypothetical protein